MTVQVLSLRKEKAQLLGFANFAELSMASKVSDVRDDAEGVGDRADLGIAIIRYMVREARYIPIKG